MATVVYFLFTPHITVTHTHTQLFPLYLHRRNPVCYTKSRKRAIDRESHSNFYQFNCLLHVLACGKATITQLKIHEYSFNSAGCSVEGVG